MEDGDGFGCGRADVVRGSLSGRSKDFSSSCQAGPRGAAADVSPRDKAVRLIFLLSKTEASVCPEIGRMCPWAAARQHVEKRD